MISLYISSEDGITPKIFSFKLKQNFHLEPVFIIVYNHGEIIRKKMNESYIHKKKFSF